MPKILTRKSHNRLSGYDYSQLNHYYVTICSNNHTEWFGEIQNNEMMVNDYGNIIKQQWEWLSKQYDYVELDEYIVMPNHIHGILIINNSIRTGHDLSLHMKSLSSLIGAFKTTSSKSIHQKCLPEFKWQRSFYDHVIRNDKSLYNIRKYIIDNLYNRATDENNIKNMKNRGTQ